MQVPTLSAATGLKPTDAFRLWSATRSRAKKNSLEFDIPLGFIEGVLERGVCQVTGIPFDTEEVLRKRPWIPSVDRIDSKRGYVMGNVQIVVWAYNQAKWDWPPSVFHRLSTSYTRNLHVCSSSNPAPPERPR